MDLPNALATIKQLIGGGNIEQALEQLVALLDSDPKYAELAQTARVNQGELYQVKAQILKNTIAPENARLATNQLTDNALQIIRRLEAGKLTFEDAEAKPSHAQAWRYYLIGGIVALTIAILAWQFFAKDKDECLSTYSKDARYRVMILPFRQTGDMKNFEPELEIMDGLNKLIIRTPGLKADAAVNKGYDIEKNYPSFTEAGNIASDCDVQMIVWGKINKSSEREYKIDVFYKLFGAGVELSTGDTTLSNLLKTREEGEQLTRDAAAVTNLLYIVLANQARVPIAANLITDIPPPNPSTTLASDTSWMYMMLALAENYKNNKQEEKAIETYDLVLESFPENQEARQKRGALLYKKGDFAASADDLALAAPDAKSADPDLLKIRADASLKSGNPAKAMEDLRTLRQSGSGEETWIQQKIEETRDTMSALQKRLDGIERQAKRDPRTQLEAAKASAGLGYHDKALKYASQALKNAPKNEDAYEVKVETQLAQGDTSGAEKTLREAIRNGISTKAIQKWRPGVKPLEPPPLPKQQEH